MFSILIKEQLQVSSLFNAAPVFSKSDSQLFRTSPPPKDHFIFQSLFTFSTLSIAQLHTSQSTNARLSQVIQLCLISTCVHLRACFWAAQT